MKSIFRRIFTIFVIITTLFLNIVFPILNKQNLNLNGNLMIFTGINSIESKLNWYYYTTTTHCVAMSSDGKYIVAGNEDGQIYFFEESSSTPLWTFSAGDNIRTISISGDGSKIIAGTDNSRVYLLNSSIDISKTEEWVHITSGPVRSVAISFDGKYAAAGSTVISGNSLNVYNVSNIADPILYSVNPGATVDTLSISHYGFFIGVGCTDNNIYLYKRIQNYPEWQYNVGNYINDVILSESGFFLVAGTENNQVLLFNVTNSVSPHIWNYTTGGHVKSVGISEDGTYIVAGSEDNNLYLFEKSSNLTIWTKTFSHDVNKVAINDDGTFILAGENQTIHYFSVDSSNPISSNNLGDDSAIISDLDISTSGNRYVVGADDDNFFDTFTGVYYFTNLKDNEYNGGNDPGLDLSFLWIVLPIALIIGGITVVIIYRKKKMR